MKRITLNLLVVVTAFCMGLGAYSLLQLNFLTYKPFGKKEIVKTNTAKTIKPHKNKESAKLTFEPTGATACGWDTYGSNASFKSSEASDGTIIHSTIVTSLYTEKSVQKRFKLELKKAGKIIELKPVLNSNREKIGEKSYFQSKGKVFLVKYYKTFSKYGGSYNFTIDETSSLKHAKAFEKHQMPKNVLKESITSDELFSRIK